MKISYSELALLGKPVLENVDSLIALGAKKIELMQEGEPWDDVDRQWDKLAKELVQRKVEYSVHPPPWDHNLTSETHSIREAVFDLYKRCIEFTAAIGGGQMVLHPGFYSSPAFSKDTAKKRALEATHKLSAIAKPLGVKLAFENVGFRGQSLYDMEEFISVLDGMDETVGYLIDTGHAHLNGWDIPGLIRRTAPRLLGIHLHDNDGKGDSHRPLYEGTINWDPIVAAIRETYLQGEIILEYAPFVNIEQYPKDEKTLMELLKTT